MGSLRDILDNLGEIAYVCDLETYEMLYASKALEQVVGDDWKGKPCYRVVQDEQGPCDFCTNHLLGRDAFYSWSKYNDAYDRSYALKDKIVDWNGRSARLEIAFDMTDHRDQLLGLETQLSVQRTLVRCAQTLFRDVSGQNGLDELLSVVGEFYDADRAYLLESSLNGTMISNTFEWCADGVEPQIDELQEVPLSSFERWTDSFAQTGVVRIADLEQLDHESEEYQMLAPQGIKSLFVMPLYEGGGIIRGMLGIDNPRRNIDQAELLRSVTYFVQNELEKRQLLDRLGELSHADGLTGVANRNGYMERLAGLADSRPATFGVVFADINDLKLANDTQGHSFGDAMIRHLGQLILELFPGEVYRIGGDEFVAFAVDESHEEFEERVRLLRARMDQDDILNVSIGSVWSDQDVAPSDLVVRADRVMYEEKRAYHQGIGRAVRSPRDDAPADGDKFL